MEVQTLPSDTISNLPPNIIQTILTLMPMRDAFRTSILSPNWRDHCLNIPKLEFDGALFEGSVSETLSVKCKLLHIVYPILLLHKGPILEFSLHIPELNSCREIDKIILHLSRSAATLKKFTLWVQDGDDHKLCPAFFKLQNLTFIYLENCSFQPPLTFKGFSRLLNLYFANVSVTMRALLGFISSCPLLKCFALIGDEKHLLGRWNSDFVELFECLPLVEYLCMDSYPIQCFATGVIPQKLPTSLVNLKRLQLLRLCFEREVELRSALLLVTSSPNIEQITIQMQNNRVKAMSPSVMNLVDQQDYSYVILDHLHLLQITDFTYMKPAMDFVKFILAKSPVLKKMDIKIDKRTDVYGEVKMLKELVQYPRASTLAKIIFERP